MPSSVAYERRYEKMQLRKWSIALLALLLAAMVMVPMVSAAEINALAKNASDRIIITPKFDDSQIRIKAPMNESEIVSFEFSEKWLNENNLNKNSDDIKISIPKSALSTKQAAADSNSALYSIGTEDNRGKTVLLQIPKDTYETMNPQSAQTITLDYPRECFAFYTNADEMLNGIEQRKLVRYNQQTERIETNSHSFASSVPAATSNLYAEWASYNTNANQYPVALRGDMTPQTLSNQGQSFVIYHEREIYFNRNGDQIELTLWYTDNGKIYLSVPVYDEGTLLWGQSGVPPATWIDASSRDRFYYEVYILANGQYNINFLDTGTGIWYRYTYNDSDNPSTYITGITGSSELYLNGALAHSFQATTNTIKDYGVKDTVNGNWLAPGSRFTWDRYKYDSLHNGLYVFMNSYNIGGTIYTYHDASNTDT
jgi:hypothetical protein